MKRIEKSAKKQIQDDNEAVNALTEKYNATLNCFVDDEKKNISEANLNIHKLLSNIVDGNSDDIVAEMFNNMAIIQESNENISILENIRSFLIDEIQERNIVKGLSK